MARDVANVWWAMFGFSVVVLVVVSALWIYAMLRQPRTHSAEEAKRINRRWIIGGGLVLPTVSIVALLAFGILPDAACCRCRWKANSRCVSR